MSVSYRIEAQLKQMLVRSHQGSQAFFALGIEIRTKVKYMPQYLYQFAWSDRHSKFANNNSTWVLIQLQKNSCSFWQLDKLSIFYCISNDKNFIPKYPDNALTDSVLASRTSRRLLEEKAPENDYIVRNNAASIIGNGVISLLWQLRCHCNPDHDQFSSLSNTTVTNCGGNFSKCLFMAT